MELGWEAEPSLFLVSFVTSHASLSFSNMKACNSITHFNCLLIPYWYSEYHNSHKNSFILSVASDFYLHKVEWWFLDPKNIDMEDWTHALRCTPCSCHTKFHLIWLWYEGWAHQFPLLLIAVLLVPKLSYILTANLKKWNSHLKNIVPELSCWPVTFPRRKALYKVLWENKLHWFV